ncbi:MAG: hypothetical protein IKE45_05630 [Halomonas sp.]|nr:hypothetical protein [Halomonas sp.]MBR2513493.1 hypothetical protein [Halomonas sp.]
MLWSRYQWKALEILAAKFELEPRYELRHRYPYHAYDLLEDLERKLEGLLAERGEEHFYQIDKEVSWAVRRLTYSELSSLSYGIDYNLELRTEKELVSEDNYPFVFYCLVALPKIRDEGLVKENHGMGYHIHYVVVENKKQKRTSIVFTFNPSEITQSQHILYWEHHGSGLKRVPERFGNRRRNAIYDTSCGFLSKISKQEFRAPVSAANVLWPHKI